MSDKPTTIAEFMAFCEANREKSLSDFYQVTWEYLDLWREALRCNSSILLQMFRCKDCIVVYKTLVNLHGTDVDKDLQQFFDDNKDQLE